MFAQVIAWSDKGQIYSKGIKSPEVELSKHDTGAVLTNNPMQTK